ncbi:ABC transporter permease subunit [Pseudooceanicola sp. GBMRC 2024]|uniref:ABC transporter permease subunit n=1 Tax=Pseudooceanicola albus TaxID=2692189 RepID=A0A6L7G100_9RHOB|nr:ABC transporter permease [Pseudooceanicola albus]MXN17735.1 ABC transporter permease subunit [Pseudooceanicola albus]
MSFATLPSSSEAAIDLPPRPRSGLAGLRRELAGNPLGLFAAVVVALAVLVALIGPWIAPYDPTIPDFMAPLSPPSAAHWLGTDQTGFDILSKILAAPRYDLGIALSGTLIALLIGAPLGMMAGYNQGRRTVLGAAGETVMRLADIVQSFPVFVLALGLVAMRGPSVVNVVIAVAFVSTPQYLRLFRSETLGLRSRAFIDAARTAGLSNLQIARAHVAPNVMGVASVQISVSIGFAVLLTAGLSFLGAGVQPPTPELGAMVADGASNIVTGAWWPSVFPGLAICLIVMSFSLVGDIVAALLDPRRRA